MGLPSRFFEKKFVEDEKGDDITPFDGIQVLDSDLNVLDQKICIILKTFLLIGPIRLSLHRVHLHRKS